VCRLLLLLAALDSLALGLWAVLRPQDLFALLLMPLSDAAHDRLLLWRALGLLALAHAGLLAILVWRPEMDGPLVLVPLIGRALGAGLWLWVARAERLDLPSLTRPLLLAAHDAVWLPVFAGFLLIWCRWRRAAGAAPSLPDRTLS
jgi:hypothetical protein